MTNIPINVPDLEAKLNAGLETPRYKVRWNKVSRRIEVKDIESGAYLGTIKSFLEKDKEE